MNLNFQTRLIPLRLWHFMGLRLTTGTTTATVTSTATTNTAATITAVTNPSPAAVVELCWF